MAETGTLGTPLNQQTLTGRSFRPHSQPHEGSAPTTPFLRGFLELAYQGVLSQQLANPFTLYSLAATVDEAHLAEARLDRGLEVRIQLRPRCHGVERVQIDRIFDRNDYWSQKRIAVVRHGYLSRPTLTRPGAVGMVTLLLRRPHQPRVHEPLDPFLQCHASW